MRIALFGGTGRIGGHVLTWALDAGHEVTVLVRDPYALTRQLANSTAAAASCGSGPVPSAAGLACVPAVTVVAGSVADPGAVTAVVDGAQAVLSALGPRGTRTPALLGTAGRNIVAAMHKTGSRRIICVSAAGAFIAGDPDTGALIKMILPRVLARPFADTREMEAVVAASGLDWTLVRPARLVNTALTGIYRVRPEYPPPGGRKISRADVAHFIGATLEQSSWLGGAPALAY